MDIQNLVESIKNQQKQIESNQQERNLKYKECMANFRAYLTDQINQIQQTLEGSSKRNKTYMNQYEITYERILTGAEEIVRRMKRTYKQKKEFCRRIMQDHAQTGLDQRHILSDQMIQNQDKYFQAIQNQKMPKINFSKYLQSREISQQLEQQKDKNRVVQQRLTMYGTSTGWGKFTNKNNSPSPFLTKINQKQGQSFIDEPIKVINHFMQKVNKIGNKQIRKITLMNFQEDQANKNSLIALHQLLFDRVIQTPLKEIKF